MSPSNNHRRVSLPITRFAALNIMQAQDCRGARLEGDDPVWSYPGGVELRLDMGEQEYYLTVTIWNGQERAPAVRGCSG